jgi:hypothetical protein
MDPLASGSIRCRCIIKGRWGITGGEGPEGLGHEELERLCLLAQRHFVLERSPFNLYYIYCMFKTSMENGFDELRGK